LLENITGKHVLYTYSIGHMLPKDKILFHYAAKGRNGKEGVFSKLRVNQLGPCVLLVPEDAEAKFDEFLQKWNCPFTKRGVLVGS